MLLENILSEGAGIIGIGCDDALLRSFRAYYEYLEEMGSVMNLTAIKGEEDVARLHFLDCMAVIPLIEPAGKSVIDIGSGAGFPGLPVKLTVPSVKLTMVDALAKRVSFLTSLCEKCGTDAECLHARAEELALKPGYRDSFDIASSRAVARLNILAELCLPFVKPGGIFAAMKSADCEEELNEAKNAIKLLGAKTEKVVDYVIPGTDIPRKLIIIRKLTPTPKGYPRRFSKISKTPL